jgi:hypothetical protein
MVEILDEDALDEVHVVDGEHGLAQQEPAVVVMALEPPVVSHHQVSHVLLAKEELLYGRSMRHHCTKCTFTCTILVKLFRGRIHERTISNFIEVSGHNLESSQT